MGSLSGLYTINPNRVHDDRLKAEKRDEQRINNLVSEDKLPDVHRLVGRYVGDASRDPNALPLAAHAGRVVYDCAVRSGNSKPLLDAAEQIFKAVSVNAPTNAVKACIGLCCERKHEYRQAWKAFNGAGENALQDPQRSTVMTHLYRKSSVVSFKPPKMPGSVHVVESDPVMGAPSHFTLATPEQ